ncbi:Uncharacterized protein SCF082_LOCUS37188 [Durusdinium trenchii]
MGFDVKTCSKYQALLNFTDQAMALVQDLQKAYPRDQFILTGHSLGGMLAILTAGDPRVTRGDAVALAFAPTPWRKVAQLQGEADGLVALCDPYDCGINSFFVPGARLAASTCLFLHQEEPKPCQGLPEPYETSRWRDELLRARPGDPLVPLLLCKGSAHRWAHYKALLSATDSARSNLPVCSRDFSVLQTRLSTG